MNEDKKKMKFVAFLRNVNLGQPKSPTRTQLEKAFLQAGATEAVSFLSNGTVVFSTSESHTVQEIANRARDSLQEMCGLQEPVFVCSLTHLVQLINEEPFSDFKDTPLSDRAMSFFDPKMTPGISAPFEPTRKDCLVIRIEGGEALSIIRAVNGKRGYPTRVLEKAIQSPVTTRSWTTILRLVKKFG